MSANGDDPPTEGESPSFAPEDEFPHESLVLPAWVQLLTGLILLALLSGAIWKALN